jgi:hypothetical protein
MWHEMTPKVFKDRTDNEGAAWVLRLANLTAVEDCDDNTGSMGGISDAEDEGGTADGERDAFLLDPKYL